MDGWTLVASGASTLLTLMALVVWSANVDKGVGISNSTWIEKVQSDGLVLVSVLTVIGFLVALIWIWVTGFHPNTITAFTWPYAAGYAWGSLTLKVYFKLPKAKVILLALLITILALGALYVVISTSRLFSSLLSPVLIAFNAGNTHWTINGYALLGASGFILVASMLPFMIVGIGRDIKAFKIRVTPPLTDEALRTQILQRMDRGETVTKNDFPDVDWVKIQNVMAAIAQSLPSVALKYDTTAATLAYRNASGIRRLYNACHTIDSIKIDATDEQRINAARALVQLFVREIGLPGGEVDVQLHGTDFTVATMKAGNLYPLLPAQFPVFVPMLNEDQFSETSNQVTENFQALFNAEHAERGFGLVLLSSDLPLLRDLLTLSDEGVELVYLDQKDIRTILVSGMQTPKEAFKNFVTERVSLASIIPVVSVTDGSAKAVTFVGSVSFSKGIVICRAKLSLKYCSAKRNP